MQPILSRFNRYIYMLCLLIIRYNEKESETGCNITRSYHEMVSNKYFIVFRIASMHSFYYFTYAYLAY